MVNYIVHIRERNKAAGAILSGIVEIPEKGMLIEFRGFSDLAKILARNGLGSQQQEPARREAQVRILPA